VPSSSVVTLRFPRGSEFHLSETVPNVGDVLDRDRDSWIVRAVEAAEDGSIVVTLGPEPKLQQPPA
jgi:hypothetical protein